MWLWAALGCASHPAALTPAPSRGAEVAGPSALSPDWRRSTVATLGLSPDDPSVGPADARFTLVSYTDFFCPHCGNFWPKLVALAGRTPDLRIVAKNWPIDKACNPIVQGDRHSFACLAAAAAECANDQAAFLPMADLLYTLPEHVTPTEVGWYATQVGIDPYTFTACLHDPRTAERVRADVQSGIDANIEGTPSIFLGGLEPGWVQVSPEIVVIEQVLGVARGG